MPDANKFRDRLTPLNPCKRVTVDERRSGNMGRDGYAVLDQAKPGRYEEGFQQTGGGPVYANVIDFGAAGREKG